MRTVLLILLLGAAGIGKGYAYDFVVNGIYYNVTNSSEPRTVEVTYRNENYNCYSGEIEIPSTVTHNGNTYLVTRIGNKAFYSFNYHEITSIILPNSIMEIGGYAFDGCDRITSMVIPNSVTIIEGGAFTCCYGLTSITIPESVETIGGVAFQFCDHLEIVNYNALNCTSMGTYNNLQSLPAFEGCTAVTTLNIGENVQNIPNNAFKGCTALTTVNFNAINCTAARSAFDGCTNLSTINYGNRVEHIDARINGCSNLSSFNIPNSVTSIRSDFGQVFPGSNWFNSQLDGILYHDGWCLGYKMNGEWPIGKLVLQNGTKGICDGAFEYCAMLDTVILPNSISYIGKEAFLYCNRINNNIVIPNIVLIGQEAFSYCEQIVSITMGTSIMEIGDYAFSNCTNLNTIILLNPTPPELGRDVFQNISPVAALFVPCGSQLAYFSNWNIFEYNNIHEDCTPRPVSIDSSITGGTVSPSVYQASMGQEVMLTVIPNPGMQLASIIAYNTTNPSQIVPISPSGNSYEFVMPPYAVTVSATFESLNSSLEENCGIEAIVYPNPTNGLVKIEAENIRQICISNMLGQVIYNSNTSNNEFEYDFGQHGEGVYLIRIDTTNGIVTKRVAVTK